MIFDMDRQIAIFIFSLASGIIIGILFDLYRIIRGNENPGNIVTAIEDLLFWILTAMIVFIFMMYTNYAYLSFNIFVYMIVGLIIHLKLLSGFFISIMGKIYDIFTICARVSFYYIFYPFRIIFQKITKKSSKK